MNFRIIFIVLTLRIMEIKDYSQNINCEGEIFSIVGKMSKLKTILF